MSEFKWERDLDDDCILDYMGYRAHCELMDKGEENGYTWERWYFSVWRGKDKQVEDIIHSTSDDLGAYSGEGARKICELLIRGLVARDAVKTPAAVFSDWLEEHGEIEAAKKLRQEFVHP